MRKIAILSLLLVMALGTKAWSHSFWVNAYDSFTHPPGHALITLGFGHEFPLDDLLAGDFGNLQIQTYDIIGPDGAKLALPLPDTKRQAPNELGSAMTFEMGDIGLRKVQFKEGAPEGTYQVSAVSAPTFFTQYVNKEGKQKTVMQSLDQVKDADKVIFSVKYQSFAKSAFNYKKSTEASALNTELEIIPLVDTSTLRVGDLLPVKVLFKGQPLATAGTDIQYVTASSNTFGGPDKFSLFSYLMEGGKGQFRLPTAGQWMVSVHASKSVDRDPTLAELKGKTHFVWYSATMTIDVKP